MVHSLALPCQHGRHVRSAQCRAEDRYWQRLSPPERADAVVTAPDIGPRALKSPHRNVLGRDHDETGYRYWLGLLDSRRLTRGTLVRWVAANPEFVSRYPYATIPR